MSNHAKESVVSVGSTKWEEGNTIKNIVIDGGIADINIMSSDEMKNISAILYTKEEILPQQEPSLLVTEINGDVKIDVKWSGAHYPVPLYLHISIPNNVYNSITATNRWDNITVEPSVQAKELTLETTSGNLIVETIFYKILKASSSFGNININLNGKEIELLDLHTFSNGIKITRPNDSKTNPILEVLQTS